MRALVILFGLMATAAAVEAHVDIYGGGEIGFDDAQDPKNRGEYGIRGSYQGLDWPVGIAVNVLHSYGKGENHWDNAARKANELQVGVTRDILPVPFQPFVSGGLSVARINLYNPLDNDDGHGIGLWAEVGVRTNIGPVEVGAVVGLTTRRVWTDDDHGNLQGGGARGGIFVGVGF